MGVRIRGGRIAVSLGRPAGAEFGVVINDLGDLGDLGDPGTIIGLGVLETIGDLGDLGDPGAIIGLGVLETPGDPGLVEVDPGVVGIDVAVVGTNFLNGTLNTLPVATAGTALPVSDSC